MKEHYTYIHTTPDGVVFYVGKGKGRRVYSTSDRSIAWRGVVADNDGLMMKVHTRFDSDTEAYAHEVYLIDAYKEQGLTLVNFTSGGKGVRDYCMSDDSRRLKGEQMRGYKHKIVTCPHCGFSGGETATKRWHFDNCSGVTPPLQARVTIDGVRLYLGKFHTKEAVDCAITEAVAGCVITGHTINSHPIYKRTVI